MEELIHDFMLINLGINPPVGEVYHGVESSKGELGFYHRERRDRSSVAHEDPFSLNLQSLRASR